MVLKPGREGFAEGIFRKWELDFAVIGEVTDTGHMVLEWNGAVVADIPLGPLADEAPLYERPYLSQDEYKAWAKVEPLGDIPESTDIGADLLKLMASPAIASRRWIWEQYDSQVGGDTVQTGGDAAIVRIHGTKRGLAMTTDCTPRYCFADPVEGGKQAVAEAYRNLCAVGATPLAVTNCLNFGNPQRPEIMAQIVGCLEGMSEACIALDMPIVSGNVSLYNETKNEDGSGSAILPTPAIGAVGVIEDVGKAVGIGFKAEGQQLIFIGSFARESLGQSLWLQELHGRKEGLPPTIDLGIVQRAGEMIRQLIDEGLLTAVHDVSDGGLAVAVTEMALAGNLGIHLDPYGPPGGGTLEDFLFGEGQSAYVVTVQTNDVAQRICGRVEGAGLDFSYLGEVMDERRIQIGDNPGSSGNIANIPLAELRAAHEGFLPRLMGADGALA